MMAKAGPPSVLTRVFTGIKEVGPLFGAINTAIVGVGGAFPFWITTSPSLRSALVAGVLLGGVIGFVVTPYPFSQRTKKPKPYLIGLVTFVVFAFLLLMLVNPENQWAASIHDFLIVNPLAFNGAMFVFVGVIFFCATSIVCIIAKKANK